MPDPDILTTSGMIDHLGSNVINICPIWKIVSRDGVVAPYAQHTRTSVGRLINPVTPFTFGGVTYRIAPVQATRDVHKIGLSPNSNQVSGIFDDLITRKDVEGGRWQLAKVVFEYVNYLDLTIGSTSKLVGVTGRWSPKGPAYEVELLSNSNLIAQLIGDLTSPTDRNSFPAGLSKAAWTISRTVASSSDRRHLVISGATPADNYYQYGVIVWTSGANLYSPGMEIKGNVGTAIELQLPMPNDIAIGDGITLLAGYDGSRSQLRDKFGDAINGNMEPDLPGLKQLFSYPE